VVRYVVANDSHAPAGPFTVVGTLYRNGVKVRPGGQPNVVTAQQIWKMEFSVSESIGYSHYVAKIVGDVGSFVAAEDEANSQDK
jgi:hypothetical protein